MAGWDVTHGNVRGAFMVAGNSQLYVREGGRGFAADIWLIYVDGRLEGTARGEVSARASAEFAVRCMVDTGASGDTAAA